MLHPFRAKRAASQKCILQQFDVKHIAKKCNADLKSGALETIAFSFKVHSHPYPHLNLSLHRHFIYVHFGWSSRVIYTHTHIPHLIS